MKPDEPTSAPTLAYEGRPPLPPVRPGCLPAATGGDGTSGKQNGTQPSPPTLGYSRGSSQYVSYWIRALALLGSLVALLLLFTGVVSLVNGFIIFVTLIGEGRLDLEWTAVVLLAIGVGGGMLLASATLGYVVLRIGPSSKPLDGDHERSAE